MADAARLSLLFEYADNTDYNKPEVKRSAVYTAAPSYQVHAKLEAATGGTTFELGNYTTIGYLVVLNHDTTNFVTVTHQYNAASVAMYLPAASSASEPSFIVFHNPTVGNDLTLTADTAACEVEIFGMATA